MKKNTTLKLFICLGLISTGYNKVIDEALINTTFTEQIENYASIFPTKPPRPKENAEVNLV